MNDQPTSVQDQIRSLLMAWMADNGITQAELARRIGRTPKHVNQVLNGKAGTHEYDYWAFVLGARLMVTIETGQSDE